MLKIGIKRPFVLQREITGSSAFAFRLLLGGAFSEDLEIAYGVTLQECDDHCRLPRPAQYGREGHLSWVEESSSA